MKTPEKWSPPLNTKWARWKKRQQKCEREEIVKTTGKRQNHSHSVPIALFLQAKTHKKNTIQRIHFSCTFRCIVGAVVRSVGKFDKASNQLSHAVFFEIRTKKMMKSWQKEIEIVSDRGSETQQTKSVYTIFFSLLPVVPLQNGQRAINQALCYLIHR